MPLNYAYGQFPCTVVLGQQKQLDHPANSSLWVNNNPGTRRLKDNVICSTGDMTLDTNDASGNVTLVAQGRLRVRASDADLRPYWNNVLLYSSSSGNDAIQIDRNDQQLTGFIHAPNGRVDIEGSDHNITGSIVADRVSIEDRRHEIDASGIGQIPAPPTIWLVE
jgi:hypothetical protein